MQGEGQVFYLRRIYGPEERSGFNALLLRIVNLCCLWLQKRHTGAKWNNQKHPKEREYV